MLVFLVPHFWLLLQPLGSRSELEGFPIYFYHNNSVKIIWGVRSIMTDSVFACRGHISVNYDQN